MKTRTEMTLQDEPAQSSKPANGGRSESRCYPTINPKFQPETETPCPCCGEMALEKAFQPPIVKGKPGLWQIHCTKPGCPMRARTLSIADFMAEAQTKANNHE